MTSAASTFQRILYVAHDHLNRDRGVLTSANPETDAIVLVESARMTSGRPWHPERLFFLLSSARHFAAELEAEGFTVRYIQAPTTIDGLTAARAEFGDLPIHSAGCMSITNTMPSNPIQRPAQAHLANEPAGHRERFAAGATILVSVVLFMLAVPYATVALAPFPAFIPIYVTALVIFDLITAVLLFGQYRALGAVGLLVLGGAYLFTATATAAYALIFPGLFAPTGLLGSGPQTSSALYMLWHAGFPLAVMAYALIKHQKPRGPQWVERGHAHRGIVATVGDTVIDGSIRTRLDNVKGRL